MSGCGTLEGMFERFTHRARRVLVLAQEEARLLNHNFIGTEHLLLGLIHEGEGVAAVALDSLGVSLEGVRQWVEQKVGPTESSSGSPPFTPRGKKVLELSLREALQLGHNYIGTEHMLLGLVREGEGVGVQALISVGVDPSQVRQRVIHLLSGYHEPDSPSVVQRLRDRLDAIEAILVAVDNWSEISDLVRSARDRTEARNLLAAPPFSFSQAQAEHVLNTAVVQQSQFMERRLLEERDRLVRAIEDRSHDSDT
jgi:ATP-dependent Clp protease ATP-binding subunit ClpA